MNPRRGLSAFARGEAENDACIAQVNQDFLQVPLNQCLPDNSERYLESICQRCNVNGISVDPLSALGVICPVDSASLASTYSCSNRSTTQSATSVFKTSTPSRVSSPAAFSPLRTITLSASIPTRSMSSSPLSTANSTSDITTSLVTLSQTRSVITITPTSDTANPTGSLQTFTSVSKQKSGLSTGAKAGIGIAGGVILILLFLAIIFFCRRRKNRNAGWTSKGMSTREIYPDDRGHSAYALNGGYSESPIGTALTTENKAQLDAGGFVPVVREIYMDEEDEEIQPSDSRSNPRTSFQNLPSPAKKAHSSESRRPNSQNNSRDIPSPVVKSRPPTSHSRPSSQNNFRDIQSPVIKSRPPPSHSRSTSQNNFRDVHSPTPRPLSLIPRKEIPTPTPPPAYPATLPRNIYTPSPTQNRSDSRVSGSLRGPVPDMYAYGGETIENDEELERLEEEERRIDEAIQESERLARMKAERDAVRARIEEGRARRGDI